VCAADKLGVRPVETRLSGQPFERFDLGVARGVVKFYKEEKGWGAISCADLPAGLDAWVHFSAIEADGYRSFEAGDQVDFDYEPARQDSFRFRATRARKITPAS
jgi:cold shock protein